MRECARIAAADDFIEGLSEKYDTIIGERGTGLSGGQKQRIALARALAMHPSILIMDDTTSALDSETEHYIQQQLLHLPFSCTKIIIGQRISAVKDADQILVLENGRITERGTHEELLKNHGYYWQTYALQNDLPDGRSCFVMARNKFDVDETLESPFQWKHLKRAFQYIGRHRFQMMGALALSVLASICTLYTPKIMSRVLDEVVPAGDVQTLVRWALIYCGLIVVSIVFTVIRARVMAYVSQEIIFDIRRDLFASSAASCPSATTTAARPARFWCGSSTM